MTRFSANLGFLWADRELPVAIRAAKLAGFDAVECHWPFDIPASEVKAALNETGLPMMGLNTRRGNVENGENGLSALHSRQDEARKAITEAIDYAEIIGAGSVHVMAGNADGAQARTVFIDNLRFATKLALPKGITILIEPLNRFDAPGYFLKTVAQAREIIEEVKASNLKLMFDCYHVGRTEGDVLGWLRTSMPIIGHIQFASVPDRGCPDQGTIDYKTLFSEISAMGWTKPLGAEYKPTGQTEASLQWLETFAEPGTS